MIYVTFLIAAILTLSSFESAKAEPSLWKSQAVNLGQLVDFGPFDGEFVLQGCAEQPAPEGAKPSFGCRYGFNVREVFVIAWDFDHNGTLDGVSLFCLKPFCEKDMFRMFASDIMKPVLQEQSIDARSFENVLYASGFAVIPGTTFFAQKEDDDVGGHLDMMGPWISRDR